MLRRLFRALPDAPRARLLQARLLTRDLLRTERRFARPDAPHGLPACHAWTQVIHETPTAEAKRHNLRLAADALQRTRIAPGEVFSFARVGQTRFVKSATTRSRSGSHHNEVPVKPRCPIDRVLMRRPALECIGLLPSKPR